MADRKEIDLLIRAQLKGGRDLAAITKSIGELEKAIDSQAEAAKRGESSYEGLKAAAAALKVVQDELGARSKVAKNFEDLTKRINDQSAAVDKAKKKLEDFEAKAGSDRTAAQQEQVQKLSASYQAATAKLELYRRSLETTGAALREAGADTANLAAEQIKIADQQLAAATAQNRVNKELLGYTDTVAKARAATAAKTATDKAAAAAADLVAAADKRAVEEARKRGAAVLDAADARISRVGQGTADRRQFDEEAAALKRAKELADLRADIERRSAVTVRDTGLRKTADDAEATARQFVTLARASTDLRPRVVTLREAINDLINPGAKVRQTLDGLESEIKQLSDTIAGSKGPVKDYSEQFQKLQDAQKAITGQATLIDSFRKQRDALRTSVEAMVSARAEVAKYAAAVRQGGDAAQQFVKPLTDAQARLRLASIAMRDQVAATRETRGALAQAGIDTRSLASAQDRLIAATKTTTGAMKQLTDAAEKNGHAVTRGAKGFSLWRDEGRTTLSITQRIRGEILALITAYIGVQGAINLAAGALKSFTQLQALQSTLAFATGADPRSAEVAKEIVYLKDQVDRLGISFEQGSKGYAKFSAAARKSGAPIEESRFIFEAFSEVARVISLTPDELNGLFNAIGQSFSKGKIQAEELRQQIGERLPGAFAFAQQALAKDFPDLDKALEKGLVGVENMVTIAESVRKAAQGQLPQAIKSLDAEQQRFNNSVLFFKNQIAEAGFADAYVALLKQIAEFFRSTDGAEFARSLGEIAKSFVNGIGALIKYRDELQLLVTLLAAVVSANLIGRLGTAVVGLTGALTLAQVAAALMAPVVFTLAGAFSALSLAVGAFIAGFAIGDWLRTQSRDVRIFGIAMVQTFLEVWARIKHGALELWEGMPVIVENALRELLNRTASYLKKLVGLYSVILDKIGLDDIAKKLRDATVFMPLKPTERISTRAAELRKELEDIRRIAKELAEAEGAAGSAKAIPAPKVIGTTPFPGKRKGKPAEPDAAGLKAKLNEIQAIRNALNEMQAGTLKKQGETLDSLLAAVDLQFADLAARIAKLGGAKGAEFAKAFAAGIAARKEEITKDFNEKILAEQQTLQSKLDQLDASAGRRNKSETQARLDAIQTANEQTFRDIAALRDRLLQAKKDPAIADEMKQRAEGAVKELQRLEGVKILNEQLIAQEKTVNDLIQARDAALKAVADRVAAGGPTAPTQGQADTESQGVITQLQPGIEAAIETARQFAIANQAAFDPARLTEFLLKLEQARGSGAALGNEFDRVGLIIKNGIGSGIDGTFNALYESLGNLVKRTGDWGDVFESTGRAILQTLANILREIALTIIKEQILLQIQMVRKALTASSGVGGAFQFAAAIVAHTGGVVGRKGNSRRNVDPAWFDGAPHYKTGGIVGLAPDEEAAILHKNEEVLSAGNPRNALNGGLNPQAQSKSQRFVLVDDRSRIAEAMASAEGEEVTMVHLRRNVATLRQLVKG